MVKHQPKPVVEREAIVEPPKPEPSPEELAPKEPAKRVWQFTKFLNPRELIKFSETETFVFPSALFETGDETLANKILAVGPRFGIYLNN